MEVNFERRKEFEHNWQVDERPLCKHSFWLLWRLLHEPRQRVHVSIWLIEGFESSVIVSR